MTHPDLSPPARWSDVSSPEALVSAVYDVLSGRANEPRDWGRFRTLYAPGALLVPVRVAPDGSAVPDVCTVDRFIETRTVYLSAADFYETGTSYEEQRFGPVASVISGYESRRDPGEPPFAVGTNCIHCYFDGVRWWTTHVTWQSLVAPAAETKV